jgi:hypothetical protein
MKDASVFYKETTTDGFKSSLNFVPDDDGASCSSGGIYPRVLNNVDCLTMFKVIVDSCKLLINLK